MASRREEQGEAEPPWSALAVGLARQDGRNGGCAACEPRGAWRAYAAFALNSV